MTKEEVDKVALTMFNKYADRVDETGQGEKTMSLAALTNLMHKTLRLKQKFGKKFPDLVNTTFILLDIRKESAIRFAAFRTQVRHLLFLQKCPTSKQASKFYRSRSR